MDKYKIILYIIIWIIITAIFGFLVINRDILQELFYYYPNKVLEILTSYDLWLYVILYPYTILFIVFLIIKSNFIRLKVVLFIFSNAAWIYDFSYLLFDSILNGDSPWNELAPYSFIIPHTTIFQYFIFGIIMLILGIFSLIYAKVVTQLIPLISYGSFFYSPAFIEGFYFIFLDIELTYIPLTNLESYIPYIISYIMAIGFIVLYIILCIKYKQNKSIELGILTI